MAHNASIVLHKPAQKYVTYKTSKGDCVLGLTQSRCRIARQSLNLGEILQDWAITMLELLGDTWIAINTYSGGVSAVVAAITAIGGSVAWVIRLRRKSHDEMPLGRGGQGGNASVSGDGSAIGGRGGRGGLHGGGGNGGSANVAGDGMAIGGDGGDAGVSWRPTLGAPSVLEHQLELGQQIWSGHERDGFGFFVVGRGGHAGDLSAGVTVDGYRYPLLPLLQLLRLWAPTVLNAADETRPEGPQAFWDTVTKLDAEVARAAEAHTRYCLEVAMPKGLPAPDPYSYRRNLGPVKRGSSSN
ncbi:hypothetical protein [Rhizobium leucaenae]|uniref:Uncharacterized protein n=1 Tax=Rhizobium leucaenae TaxID=29450 RepID=A0A7W6ZUL7_9HYPH|nr:hypothetical protein [Rhizobium leucaenae]MBB4569048.1 hypothetical protein [Rhizobium leucaenae]MBB6299877.1 hypothetical protein [Rhizobium leucaenae]